MRTGKLAATRTSLPSKRMSACPDTGCRVPCRRSIPVNGVCPWNAAVSTLSRRTSERTAVANSPPLPPSRYLSRRCALRSAMPVSALERSTVRSPFSTAGRSAAIPRVPERDVVTASNDPPTVIGQRTRTSPRTTRYAGISAARPATGRAAATARASKAQGLGAALLIPLRSDRDGEDVAREARGERAQRPRGRAVLDRAAGAEPRSVARADVALAREARDRAVLVCAGAGNGRERVRTRVRHEEEPARALDEGRAPHRRQWRARVDVEGHASARRRRAQCRQRRHVAGERAAGDAAASPAAAALEHRSHRAGQRGRRRHLAGLGAELTTRLFGHVRFAPVRRWACKARTGGRCRARSLLARAGVETRPLPGTRARPSAETAARGGRRGILGYGKVFVKKVKSPDFVRVFAFRRASLQADVRARTLAPPSVVRRRGRAPRRPRSPRDVAVPLGRSGRGGGAGTSAGQRALARRAARA